MVGASGDELSVEERNLLSVAYKNAVGSRRAAWRIITSVHEKEKSKGNSDQAGLAREYCQKVETELQKICDTILALLDNSLITKASNGESKVFYQKMKADYYRYIAEFTEGDKKSSAAEKAQGLPRCTGCRREGFGGHASHPPWLGVELFCLPVRGVVEPRRGVQDGSHGLRRCDCRARQRI